MPYTIAGALGIGYNKKKVKGVPDSWRYLFDSAEYNGRIALLVGKRRPGAPVGRYLGPASTDIRAEMVTRIEQICQKSDAKAFHDDNGQDICWPAMWTWCWSTTATSPRR